MCVPPRLRVSYKSLVKEIFPRDVHSSQVNAREMEKLTVYALTNTDKIAKIGLYIERRVGKKFARREYGHLRCAIWTTAQLRKPLQFEDDLLAIEMLHPACACIHTSFSSPTVLQS